MCATRICSLQASAMYSGVGGGATSTARQVFEVTKVRAPALASMLIRYTLSSRHPTACAVAAAARMDNVRIPSLFSRARPNCAAVRFVCVVVVCAAWLVRHATNVHH
ncbi:hypothetical protein EON67_01695 [archaeon]|nr:MAG: hypothetical protein EON67_01695 [archaeon]